MQWKIRKAGIGDASGIFKAILANTDSGQVMLVPLNAIVKNIDEFLVVILNENIIACGALHHHYKNYLEVCSISVLKDYQNMGIGSEITRMLIDKTSSEEFIFLATDRPEFYSRFKFYPIRRRILPLRIWIHKIGSLLDQKKKNLPEIILKKFTFMKLTIDQ